MLKKLTGVLIAGAVFLLTLFSLFYVFEKYQKINKKLNDGVILLTLNPGRDHIESLLRSKGWIFQVTRLFEKKIVYQKTYEADDFYIRKSSLVKNSSAQEHAVFAGCSFTFGQGLDTEETFPWMLQKELPNINSYNLGWMGGSPQLTLEWMKYVNMKDLVSEADGKFIYTFMEDHLTRWFAHPEYLTWANKSYPHFEIINDKVVFKGMLGNQDFYKNWLVVNKMGLGNTYLHAQGQSEKWNDKHFHEFSLAINEIKEQYLKLFPKGEFYLLHHPLANLTIELREKLNSHLKRRNIKVLNPVDDFWSEINLKKLSYTEFEIVNDGHPNHRMNSFLKNWLKEHIFTQGK